MTNETDWTSYSKLMDEACPTPADVPFFNHCMHLARGMGMNWEQGLRYVIEQRKRCDPRR